jgi:hypothetical protein
MLLAGIQGNWDWTPIKTFGGDDFGEPHLFTLAAIFEGLCHELTLARKESKWSTSFKPAISRRRLSLPHAFSGNPGGIRTAPRLKHSGDDGTAEIFRIATQPLMGRTKVGRCLRSVPSHPFPAFPHQGKRSPSMLQPSATIYPLLASVRS